MTIMPRDEIVVTDIAGDVAKVFACTYEYDELLRRNGFIRVGDNMTRSIKSHEERCILISFLISIGALFSSGKDWSPEEIVDYYIGQGLLSGHYKCISWVSPDRYVISTK